VAYNSTNVGPYPIIFKAGKASTGFILSNAYASRAGTPPHKLIRVMQIALREENCGFIISANT